MSLDSYFLEIDHVLSHPLVLSILCKKEKRSPQVGLIKGHVYFVDGSELNFMEYLEVEDKIEKKTYSYHYQSATDQLIFRYDNAPHHHNIPTFPKHKHLKDGTVIPSTEVMLNTVIQEASETIIFQKK